MTKRKLLATAAVLTAFTVASFAAQANPVYIGYSLNGGAVTQLGNSGNNGSASTGGSVSVGNFAIELSGTGSPTLPETSLFSNTVSVKSINGAGGTLQLYVSETNNTAAVTSFTTGFGNNSLSTLSVLEQTYYNANNAIFGTSTLLGQANVAPGAATANQIAAQVAGPSPYSVTHLYTIVFPSGNADNTVNATLSLTSTVASNVPEPASMALLGAGLLGLGVVRRRRAA